MALFENARAFCADVLRTIEQKNSDYAAPGATRNEYFNFDAVALLEDRSAQEVIAGEIAKKAVRLCNLTKKANAVLDEPRADTLRDIIGYALILQSLDTDEAAEAELRAALAAETEGAVPPPEANTERAGDPATPSPLKRFFGIR